MYVFSYLPGGCLGKTSDDCVELQDTLHVHASPLPVDARELALARGQEPSLQKDVADAARFGHGKDGESDQAFKKHGLKMAATRTDDTETPTTSALALGADVVGRCLGFVDVCGWCVGVFCRLCIISLRLGAYSVQRDVAVEASVFHS